MEAAHSDRPATPHEPLSMGAIWVRLGAVLMLAAAQTGVTQSLYDPTHLELRGGYMLSIAVPFFRWNLFPERGTNNANIELVLPKYWRSRGSLDALIPGLHLGATANLSGRTSYAYIGGLWTFNCSRRGFAEISIGGLVHNGQLYRR